MGGVQSQHARGLDLAGTVEDELLDLLVSAQLLSERDPTVGPLAHQIEGAQLSDFGLARPLSKHSIAASRGVGAALAYAAPETLKENSPTTKTD